MSMSPSPVPLGRPRLSQQKRVELSRVSRWRSLATIAVLYALVLGLATAAHWAGGFWPAAIAFVIIAGIQHHLMTFLHEGAHLLIHPNRRVNDVVAHLACGVPFFSTLHGYRAFHLAHHRYSGSVYDPEREAYAASGYRYNRLPWSRLWLRLAADLTPVTCMISYARLQQYVKREVRSGRVAPAAKWEKAAEILFWPLVGGLAVALGVWREVLLFWVAPLLTIGLFCLRLHGYGEHTGAEGKDEYERTFNHAFGRASRFFLYPIHSGYHIEHHMFPMIPWYRVPELRHELSNDPAWVERAGAMTLDGYFIGSQTVLSRVLLKPRGSLLVRTGVERKIDGEGRPPVRRALQAGEAAHRLSQAAD